MLLLEQGTLSCGTTWHAAGLVGPLRASRERHPAGAVLRRALRLARGRDRAGHRLPQRRRGDRRPHRGPDGPAAAHGGQRRRLRPRVRDADARSRPRSCGRRCASTTCSARSGCPATARSNPTDLTQSLAKGARQRGAADRRAGAGDRRRRRRTAARGRRVTGVRTDARRRRGRGGRQLRRPVGQGRSATGGRHRAAALRRALLRRHRAGRRASTRTCRSCATPTAGPTSRRRSAAWSSAASSPRPSRGVAPSDDPVPVRVPAARGGLGALLGR